MEEKENEKRAVRIFVGGLSEAVTAEDIRRLFESLGTIQSLETIRTKGRSLAYLDFLSDPKSLSKLFSKYNGCVWKGGKLRLEKAKEHYLDRLKKEWEQDAILSTEPPAADLSTHKEDLVKEMPNSRRAADLNEKPLNIFFPRLRSVKSIPFSGTGKHKYSFQNIKVPPMPVHFCDCEEHCSPFVPKREKSSMNGEAEISGINDDEINIMNAVMNKLFEKEKVPNTKHLGKKHDSFESRDALHSNELEADSETDDDDDGIIINIATKKNKAALIGSEELERVMENQESWSNKINIDEEEPNKRMLQVQKGSNSNPNTVKKKKPLPKSESKSNEGVSSTPVGKSKMQTLLDDLGSGKQSTEPEYGFGVPAKVSWSQKSSWRELVGKGGNAAFSASLILPKFDSGKDQQNSDGSSTPSCTDDETENMEMPLGKGGNAAFSASLIGLKFDSDKDQQNSDGSLTPSSTDDETENMDSDEYLESKPTNTQVIEEPSESLTPSSTDDETENMESDEYLESKPTNNTQVIEEPSEAQPTNTQAIEEPTEAPPINKQAITEPVETQHNTVPKETGRGSAWLQKQSWTQLVNEKNNSFSISQILPGITFAEQTAKEPILHPADSNDCKHNGADKNTVNGTVIDGFNLGNIVPENSEHVGADDIVSAPVVEKTVETSPREGSSTKVEIGETCSFMRSAASLKEWAKAKAAVSGSLKRKRGEK